MPDEQFYTAWINAATGEAVNRPALEKKPNPKLLEQGIEEGSVVMLKLDRRGRESGYLFVVVELKENGFGNVKCLKCGAEYKGYSLVSWLKDYEFKLMRNNCVRGLLWSCECAEGRR